MRLSKQKIYVGIRWGNAREIFKTFARPIRKDGKPSRRTQVGRNTYHVIVGPFRTIRGATFYVKNKKDVLSVKLAEKLAKEQIKTVT